MMVRRSVLLPTPFLPSTAKLPSRGSVSETPSSTMASPYPARTSRSSSMFSQVYLAHARIAADLVGRPLDEYPSTDHDDDAAGETKHDIHVVLDEQHGQLAREIGDDREELGALVLRHA